MVRSFSGLSRRWCLLTGIAVTVSQLVATPAALAKPIDPASSVGYPEIHRHVTLLTGDEVDYVQAGDGSRVARIDAAPDRQAVSFETVTTPAGMFVYPSDALPLVTTGVVDRSLFNVTELAGGGYTDGLPIFVRSKANMSVAEALPAADKRATVTSLNGTGMRVAKSKAAEVWRSVKSRSGELAKVSLDRTVRVSLDRSTAQVGAPAAWQSGLDGTGTTVAVVDTGIDSNHPDLQGKVVDSANFSEDPDTSDAHGHGTHVASIIAGSGQASGGRYRGVASGAKLLVAKVFGSSGEAPSSQVMAGMQWAAEHGAKVVNLSLGGPVPEATDEMSELVNTLTARTGALFVVAAGNSGSGPVSVESPGVAASALTVGAVDQQDRLAPFSSRGPRTGDARVKPEIVAPGVGIVAARAADTTLGTPLDGNYTAASGTSMATPHVSGAAAILAQKYPQWTAERLKNALASSAKDIGQDWFGQGCGRLDIAHAADPALIAPATATFGSAPQTLEYTNETSAPITLTLKASVRSWTGKPVPASAVRFSQNVITVPANGKTSVTMTLQADEPGAFGGTVTASNPTTVRRTAVSRYNAPELVPVDVQVLDSSGRPRAASLAALIDDSGGASNANDPFRRETVTFLQIGNNGSTTVLVPRGTYSALATTSQSDLHTRRWTALNASEVTVNGPTTIRLDERSAVPVGVTGPQPLDQRDRTVMIRRVVPGTITEFGIAAGATSWQIRATPSPAAKRGAITLQDLQNLQPAAVTMNLGTTALHPEYDAFGVATKWPGIHELPVVLDGSGADPRGKAVLVPMRATQASSAFLAATQAAATAAAAGAGAVLVYVDSPGALTVPGLTSDSVPVFALSQEEGARVKASTEPLKVTVAAQPDKVYNISHVNANGIPAQDVWRLDPTNLVAVNTRYHADKPGLTAQKAWYALPTGLWKTQFLRGTKFAAPVAWQEFTGPVDDRTVWKRTVTLSGKDDRGRIGSLTMFQQNTYRRGESTRPPESWFEAPLRTGAVELQPDHPARYPATSAGWQEICSMCRGGTDPDFFVPPLQWSDSTAGHYTSPWQSGRYAAASSTRLFAGTTEIPPTNGNDPVALFPIYRLAPTLSRYRLETTDVQPAAGQAGVPNGALFRLATKVDTSWTFQSRRSTAPSPTGFLCLGGGTTCAFQPLIQLDYDLGLDLANQVPAGTTHTFIVHAAEHSNARDGGVVVSLQVSYSIDDGAHWQQATAVPQNNGRWSVSVPLPQLASTNGFVWLRTDARDSAGNTIRQTVQRAYALR